MIIAVVNTTYTKLAPEKKKTKINEIQARSGSNPAMTSAIYDTGAAFFFMDS